MLTTDGTLNLKKNYEITSLLVTSNVSLVQIAREYVKSSECHKMLNHCTKMALYLFLYKVMYFQ